MTWIKNNQKLVIYSDQPVRFENLTVSQLQKLQLLIKERRDFFLKNQSFSRVEVSMENAKGILRFKLTPIRRNTLRVLHLNNMTLEEFNV